jgi:hypothetical protein
MATTLTTARINQSIKTEKIDVMDFNDWKLTFTYRFVNEESPVEISVSGVKDGGGFLSVNIGQMGLENYSYNFNSTPVDIDLIKKVEAEIAMIKG